MRIPHTWNPGDTLKIVEQDLILSALRRTHGNVTEMSEGLGMSRSTLYKRLKKVGLSSQRDILIWLKTHGLGG